MTSYLLEYETENLQNGDVHLAQIPDFEMDGLSREPFGALRSVMVKFLRFSRSFIYFSTGVSLQLKKLLFCRAIKKF